MQPYRIKTISEYHSVLGISKPEHPLMSVISLDGFTPPAGYERISVVFDFYVISVKRSLEGAIKYHYGQQSYDFDEGILFCIAPNQVFSFETENNFKSEGWMLLIHPDFIWHTSLAKTIRQYGFFNYASNEALFLSDKEEKMIAGIVGLIEQEYHANIDKFTQGLIIAQIELLLQYTDRFYNRQFLTRTISSNQLLERVENLLNEYFDSEDLTTRGLPTVQLVADALAVSPTYLSALLKTLTGQSTQEHIHEKLIKRAKEKLSLTELSVSEIAYQLGFEYPQSFSKLFKNKTDQTPLGFRASFN